jgi:tetratricopeptide (TPR) repeat protein
MGLPSGPFTRAGLCLTLIVFLFPIPFIVLHASSQTQPDQVHAITSALRSKDFVRALELLEPALAQSPGDPHLLTLQALAYSGEGKNKAALTCFRDALRAAPDYLPALEGAAQIEYEAGSTGLQTR